MSNKQINERILLDSSSQTMLPKEDLSDQDASTSTAQTSTHEQEKTFDTERDGSGQAFDMSQGQIEIQDENSEKLVENSEIQVEDDETQERISKPNNEESHSEDQEEDEHQFDHTDQHQYDHPSQSKYDQEQHDHLNVLQSRPPNSLSPSNFTDGSFNFLTNKVMTDHDDTNVSEDEESEQNHSILGIPTPQKIIKESYQSKLMYLENQDFQGDKSSIFQGSPSRSIPNTFQYKSHPNARTKTSIRAKKDDLVEINESLEADQSGYTPPAKTSTIKTTDFNTTPDWMPTELTEKWVPVDYSNKDSPKNQAPDLHSEFNSSVRITRSIRPQGILDELDFGEGGTMIHNSLPLQKGTPMWKKATRDYEMAKKSQPNLQNIFLSMDSSGKENTNGNNLSNITGGNNLSNLTGGNNFLGVGINAHSLSNVNNHTVSSTVSTPMATMSNLPHSLNKGQVQELEEIVEEQTKKSYRFPNNPASPLKLFGDNYNTYTTDKLNGLLMKMNNKSTFQTPDQQRTREESQGVDPVPTEVVESALLPKLKIKEFTRTGSYTEEQFRQNADNVFKNLQKKGFRGQEIHRSTSIAHTTATSTPKSFKVDNVQRAEVDDDDEYSTFSSEFEQTSESNFQQYTNNDYTFERQRMKVEPTEDNDNDSSYTFDDLSDIEKTAPNENFDSVSTKNSNHSVTNSDASIDSFKEIKINHKPSILQNSTRIFEGIEDPLSGRVVELEKMMQQFNSGEILKELHTLADENNRLKDELELKNKKKDVSMISEISIDNADFTNADFTNADFTKDDLSNFIKWKRASQLKLLQSPKAPIGILKERNSEVIKGRVKPGVDLPVAYDNMVLDVENHKWISEDKENFSLDSIEDLVDDQDFIDESRLKINAKRVNSKLEVSFHLPHADTDQSHDEDRFRSPMSEDITRVSQLDDITFSLTQRKLVSVITDILSTGENFDDYSWNDVTEISLANHQLETIKDLNRFLPGLTSVDLSHNDIKFLDGLPKSILNLSVADNNIEGITSFYQYRDLQRLNASHNRLINLTNFSRNIHLTDLNASFNMLTTINGVNTLANLTKLNVSQNDIRGDISFRNFELLNLQDLNMSDNKITALYGLENLPNLRILNLNENRFSEISCTGRHSHLKKLLLKFNSLKELNLDCFPALRVLRIDGNSISKPLDFKRLKYLEEVSCKSQHDLTVLEKIFESSTDVTKLDISGNSELKLSEYTKLFDKGLRVKVFLNVRVLVLSAMNLTLIPHSFAKLFPNVRELNLNFNKLNDIQGLSKLKNIKKLYAVSNNITKMETIIAGLISGRSKLTVLDLRLNPCNIELYPYVFSPQELEVQLKQEAISPIHLETLDDIENFAIHYETLSKSIDDWRERDLNFVSKLANEDANSKVNQRLNYETLLINFFKNLLRLDGGIITEEKRTVFTRRFESE